MAINTKTPVTADDISDAFGEALGVNLWAYVDTRDAARISEAIVDNVNVELGDTIEDDGYPTYTNEQIVRASVQVLQDLLGIIR